MARKSKRDWLEAGIQLLVTRGADHLTIDALTQNMGVTKGSFYHHFASYADFIDALLIFYEEEGTLNIIALTEALGTPGEKLQRLLEITTSAPLDDERALRAWALQNPQVKAVQARVDRQRIDYLQSLCRELVHDSQRADHLAQLLYVTYIGGLHIALEAHTIQTLYREIIRLYLEKNDAPA